MSSTDRPGYIAGLRALADLLEQQVEIPLPYTGNHSPILWILLETGQRTTLATIARALPGIKTKGVRGSDFDLMADIDGLKVQVIADRDQVCERIVTGTAEVTREVPDPDALAAVPTTTVTETVETVEWVCAPLTAPAAVTA